MYPEIKKIEKVDENNPRLAIRQIVNYLNDLANSIENILVNLDNSNLQALDLSDLRLFTETGSEISGDKIKIKSPTGEIFEIGYDKSRKQFVFTMPTIGTINVGTLNATNITRGGKAL